MPLASRFGRRDSNVSKGPPDSKHERFLCLAKLFSEHAGISAKDLLRSRLTFVEQCLEEGNFSRRHGRHTLEEAIRESEMLLVILKTEL